MTTLPFGFLCTVLGFGLIAVMVFKLVRSVTGSGRNRRWMDRTPVDLMTSMGDDGFWISSDRVSPSSMIRYYYRVEGVQRMGQAPFQPGSDGRQFIYTGARPDSVSVALADPAAAGVEDPNVPPPISTPFLPPERTSAPPSHFPRAY
jgi:hypothetical protein